MYQLYDNVRLFLGRVAMVEKDGKWSYIDKPENEELPLMYDYIEPCWHMTRGKKEGKWDYLDETGKEIISYIYDSAEDFRAVWARVQKDGKLGYVDKAGSE